LILYNLSRDLEVKIQPNAGSVVVGYTIQFPFNTAFTSFSKISPYLMCFLFAGGNELA